MGLIINKFTLTTAPPYQWNASKCTSLLRRRNSTTKEANTYFPSVCQIQRIHYRGWDFTRWQGYGEQTLALKYFSPCSVKIITCHDECLVIRPPCVNTGYLWKFYTFRINLFRISHFGGCFTITSFSDSFFAPKTICWTRRKW